MLMAAHGEGGGGGGRRGGREGEAKQRGTENSNLRRLQARLMSELGVPCDARGGRKLERLLAALNARWVDSYAPLECTVMHNICNICYHYRMLMAAQREGRGGGGIGRKR